MHTYLQFLLYFFQLYPLLRFSMALGLPLFSPEKNMARLKKLFSIIKGSKKTPLLKASSSWGENNTLFAMNGVSQG